MAAAVGAASGLLAGPWLAPLVAWLPSRGEEHPPAPLSPRPCPTCGDPRRDLRSRLPLLTAPCRVCGAHAPRPGRAVHLTAVAAGAVLGGWAGLGWLLPAALVLAAVMVLVTFVDIATHRIPDRITFTAFPVVVVLLAVAAMGTHDPAALRGVALGAALFGAVLAVLWFVYPAGMGFGDVKLAPTLGAVLGFVHPALVVHALLAASLIGIAVGLPAVLRRGRRAEFPFGPALCLGTLVVLLLSNPILDAAGLR